MSKVWASFVILDDEEEDATSVESYIGRLFQEAGIDIETRKLTKTEELAAAIALHPDFVICDISLGVGPASNAAGLELIQNYKTKFPHVTFVAITMQYESLSNLSMLVVQPDLILSKNKIAVVDPEFERYLLGFFISNRRQQRELIVSAASEVERIVKTSFGWQKFDRELLVCLVRQAFNTSISLDPSQFVSQTRTHDLYFGDIVDSVKIDTIDQGGSGSAVFKAVPSFRGQPYRVSVILKFCRVGDYLSELANFSRYVKWMLPYTWRVDVLGTGLTATLGLIAYPLAFAGASGARTLSYFCKMANADPVRSFIGAAFSQTDRTWYEAVEIQESNLRSDLIARYFRGNPNAYNAHLTQVKVLLESSDTFFSLYKGRRAEVPGAFVARMRRLLLRNMPYLLKYQTCICHGDLHSSNIMVSDYDASSEAREKRFAFIDFQDTGRAHVATDFVVFENSLRKDSAFDVGVTAEEYYAHEKEALAGMLARGELERPTVDDAGSEYASLVFEIRQAFIRNFPDADRQQYVFHMFIFAFFMMNENSEKSARWPFLIAFFCAAADALEADNTGSKNDV